MAHCISKTQNEFEHTWASTINKSGNIGMYMMPPSGGRGGGGAGRGNGRRGGRGHVSKGRHDGERLYADAARVLNKVTADTVHRTAFD